MASDTFADPNCYVQETNSESGYVWCQQERKPDWMFCPQGDEGFQVAVRRRPNAFHRLMQWMFFGFKYKRNEL